MLIYEAIVAQVLDYDYAPASELVENRRMYFNVSQEGKSDIDFLREEELLNGLKLASKSYQPVTCFQISEKGLELAKRIPRQDKEAVHELAFVPGTRDMLRVEWKASENSYVLVGNSGYSRVSTVTDCEDVSYVSSAYVPQCLRFGGRPTLSNAHRAAECGVSVSNIRDELDEVCYLLLMIRHFLLMAPNLGYHFKLCVGYCGRVYSHGSEPSCAVEQQLRFHRASTGRLLYSFNRRRLCWLVAIRLWAGVSHT